jgi:hypothetical protein
MCLGCFNFFSLHKEALVQVRFLFRALGIQSIKKAAVSLPFFICKQFANTIFGGGEKEL